MNVIVRGYTPHIEYDEWIEATIFFGDYLLGKRMSNRCSVNLELIEYMRGDAGSITCSDWVRRRSFMIQINTGCGKRLKMLRTLGHEMIHLKQIVRRELQLSGLSAGVVWRTKTCEPQVNDQFRDEPWEREAYGRERELYKAYSSALKDKD